MTRKIGNPEKLQPSLFDQNQPDIMLAPALRPQLATLIEALLHEIAAALANEENGHEQDHR